MLKVHLLVELEKKLAGSYTTNEELSIKIRKCLPPIVPILDLQEYLDENCFCSPLSAQGMLILAAIISSRVLVKSL